MEYGGRVPKGVLVICSRTWWKRVEGMAEHGTCSGSEDEMLLQKGPVIGAHEGTRSPGALEEASQQVRHSDALRYLLVTLLSPLLVSVVVSIFAAHTYMGNSSARIRGSGPPTMDHAFDGTLKSTRDLVSLKGIKIECGTLLIFWTKALPDMKYIRIKY
ncbi:hypothetical protein M0805_000525 [Coniferiporia weirii]|nr:hypothetical protein M0805_000525 [Coniferiporia weirii]